MKEYKKKCHSNRHSFWKENLESIEKSLHDPKEFWNNWKRCSESVNIISSPNIEGQRWYEHFSNLHSENSGDVSLESSECSEPPSFSLNKPFSMNEL